MQVEDLLPAEIGDTSRLVALLSHDAREDFESIRTERLRGKLLSEQLLLVHRTDHTVMA
jgi:hypothetical protein